MVILTSPGPATDTTTQRLVTGGTDALLPHLLHHLQDTDCAARLTSLIQRLDSLSVSLLVSMVITLGHRHRLVAGEVVDLLDRDTEVQKPGDKGMVEK